MKRRNEARAEAPHPKPNGKAPRETPAEPSAPGKSKKIPPGKVPLPANAGEFVEEIHKRIDLFRVWQELLESKDEKIKQRSTERVTELRYKGAAAPEDQPQQIVIDIPRPKRD